MRLRQVATLAAIIAPLMACRTEAVPPGGAGAAEPSSEATTVPVASEVLSVMNASADPCTDFYAYACGGWLESTEIPADQSRFGRFHVLRERNKEVLRSILEDSSSTSRDPNRAKLGTFYQACMAEAAVESADTAPLAEPLAAIDGIDDEHELMEVVASLHRQGVSAMFQIDVSPDYKQPDMNIGHVHQGGLGLPDRKYYLNNDQASVQLRAAYQAHVAKMLTLLGASTKQAAKQAKQIVAFEKRLAKASKPRDEMRDPEKTYNKIDLEGLERIAPDLPWRTYFAATGHPGIRDLNVAPLSFFSRMAKVVRRTNSSTIRAYLRWHLVRSAAAQLPERFVQANFEFYGQLLRGQKQLAPRWKRCVDTTDAALGEVLGRYYVRQEFAGESKDTALDMIRGIEEAFAGGLAKLSWMDDATRARAVDKMNAIVNKIGYPDEWRDYSQLAVTADSHFQNVKNAAEWEFHRRVAEVGKAVDEKEWHMTPPTVNAYYNPLNNEMVFPAGILQRPFFDSDFPMAINFGGIGMVMGHELTHGFDDQGRKFDASGRLTEWWEPQVSEQFEQRAECVSDLYSTYEVQPGLTLNGKLTLGENIADFGGIKDAFRAYRHWTEKNGEEPEAVPGLTNEQLFFVSFGQIWCSKATPEIERVLAVTDPHSHPRYRVNGPLSNLPEFWEAFSCGEGTEMHPPNTCEVW